MGSDRKKLSGGISGNGIDKNIMDCYRFIVHNYSPGDHLFLFGFSRGAYTVRSLGGLIRNCGVLKRQHAVRIPEAYELYRDRRRNTHPDSETAKQFRRDYAVRMQTNIEFVGAWDTVGALGIPVPFWGTLNKKEFLFHDTSPSKIIQHARHAVSIDEYREDFDATLWSPKPDSDIQQVWFAGSHGNVGGGLKHKGLSDIAADWVTREAKRFGLVLESHFLDSLQPDAGDHLYNSRRGIYTLRDRHTRDIVGPLHRSVRDRWDADTGGYRKKSRALRKLLESVGHDWSRIELVG